MSEQPQALKPENISVQPAWCTSLPIQQQSVLLLAARGPDGIAKAHPCKKVQLAYRATVLLAAYWGRSMQWGESADGFMSLDCFSGEVWPFIVDEFFQHSDDLPHHYLMHLMHGAEILGYKHPDHRFRLRWQAFYERCVKELHLVVESEFEMDARLSDWDRKHWTTHSVSTAGSEHVSGASLQEPWTVETICMLSHRSIVVAHNATLSLPKPSEERERIRILVEALIQIEEGRVLVMDDEGETPFMALQRVARIALEARCDNCGKGEKDCLCDHAPWRPQA